MNAGLETRIAQMIASDLSDHNVKIETVLRRGLAKRIVAGLIDHVPTHGQSVKRGGKMTTLQVGNMNEPYTFNQDEAAARLGWAMCAACGGSGQGSCDLNYCACGHEAQAIVRHLYADGYRLVAAPKNQKSDT